MHTEVFAWGSDLFGELGCGSKEAYECYCLPKMFTFKVPIKQISCAEDHSAFITTNGSLFSMGNNSEGKLGLNDHSIRISTIPRLVEAIREVTHVSCGQGHTVAVNKNGEVYAWGQGKYGVLGIGSLKSQWMPIKVPLKVKVKQVSCGSRHTAILDLYGNLYMCGSNDSGQLGIQSKDHAFVPIRVNLPKVKQVACGSFHTLVLSEHGRVFSTGGNILGQLGTGDKTSSTHFKEIEKLLNIFVIKVDAGNISGCLTDEGQVYVWGTGVFGELLFPTLLTRFINPIKDFSIGGCSGVFVDSENVVYTWGSNVAGQLGLGDYEGRAYPVIVPLLKDYLITQVSCGKSYVLALGRTLPLEHDGINRQTKELTPEHLDIQSCCLSNEDKQKGKDEYKGQKVSMKEKNNESSRVKENKSFIIRRSERSETDAVRDKDNISRFHIDPKKTIKNYINKTIDNGLPKDENREELLLEEVEAEAKMLMNEKMRLEDKILQLESRARILRSERYDELPEELNHSINKSKEQAKKEDKKMQELLDFKVRQIKNLQDEIHRMKCEYDNINSTKDKVLNGHKLTELEEMIKKKKMQLGEVKELNQRLLLECGNLKESSRKLIQDTIRDIKQEEHELQSLQKNAEHIKEKIRKIDNEIEIITKKTQNCIFKVEDEQEALIQYINNSEHLKLEKSLEEEKNRNGELQRVIVIKQKELSDLEKEVESWSQLADKNKDKNAQLKHIIESLEAENKKILEGMNLHIYNRAAEYRQRALRKLQSPLTQLVSTEVQETAVTKKGVEEVKRLVQFEADTVGNIKSAIENRKRSRKEGFNSDYIMDRDIYKIEENPKYVHTNHELINSMREYDPDKQKTFKVTLEETKNLQRTPLNDEERLKTMLASTVGESVYQSIRNVLI